ncbi:MAG: acyl carrier protein [Prevotella sp.]|jgi:acyl carrier protein|nr:acyl carrier protein [Prevotella sp.]MCI2081320.1 acyl carrier protein [Prevotella sp.]MCI2103176.1 acyl carrier protein [Prevotella sp.]
MDKKEEIRKILSEALPLVDVDAVPLFPELDSLGITTILMLLSKEYDIDLESEDATPKNLWSLDSIVTLVDRKLSEKE